MKTLIEDMEHWRAERPDEWKMDEFIRGVQQLQTKLAESDARVARLEDVIDKVDHYHGHGHDINCHTVSDYGCECGHTDAQIALNETPAQSLQHIEAAAVERFIENSIKTLAYPHNDEFRKTCEALKRQQQTNGE